MLLVTAAVLSSVAADPASPAPGASAPAQLPEIGRVRVNSPACAAMHDLVIPSFAAFLRTNQRFTEYADALAKGAESSAPEHPAYFSQNRDQRSADVVPVMHASRAGQSLSLMFRELKRVSDALGDPRLARDSADPAVQTERAALTMMYEAQMQRLAILSEKAIRGNAAAGKNDLDLQDNGAFANANAPSADSVAKPFEPDRVVAPGESLYRAPIGFIAKADAKAWSAGLATQIAQRMNDGSRMLLPIAGGCR
jgi:hypothetical protein